MNNLPDITPHLHTKEGFCHPDWEAITNIIETSLPESDWNTAWETASTKWLTKIKTQLARNYQIYETPNFMILTEAPVHIIKDVGKSAEHSLQQIITRLEGAASDEGYGKHVILMFSNIDDYYGYLAYFFPEEESPMSGGMCLSGEGFVHFAFPTIDYSSYRTVLTHELTHVCLAHLPIPTWLNEALAMRMEQVICDSDIFHLDQEIYDQHTQHWDDETIQQFWTGESWNIPGDSFELSYNLAQIVWQKIESVLAAPRQQIMDFISQAHFQDGGESAAQAIFNISLGDLVADFLGDGNWNPTTT